MKDVNELLVNLITNKTKKFNYINFTESLNRITSCLSVHDLRNVLQSRHSESQINLQNLGKIIIHQSRENTISNDFYIVEERKAMPILVVGNIWPLVLFGTFWSLEVVGDWTLANNQSPTTFQISHCECEFQLETYIMKNIN
ncbi:hypothetical protein BpHYR1_014549 [Brachionus plicatilis]|uniref:Uncharacterized protein n=1 Tax=Brachionus plicatilis TaxID=10195 RepID=A0A3M7PTD3_BRAPC|nr:hypothetical protein BpHYR1_014549 [Brachionus plicatilis]